MEQAKRRVFGECLGGQKLELSLTRRLQDRDHSPVHIDRLTVNEV